MLSFWTHVRLVYKLSPVAETQCFQTVGHVARSHHALKIDHHSYLTGNQDQVSEADHCIVGGVQNSRQSMVDLLTGIMGIIISNPQVLT